MANKNKLLEFLEHQEENIYENYKHCSDVCSELKFFYSGKLEEIQFLITMLRGEYFDT